MEGEKLFIDHEFITPNSIEYRSYQVKAAKYALNKNTLIVLPTGTGKTVIGLLVIAHWLEKNPGAKIIFIAPTRPLVEQHYQFLKNYLNLSPDRITWLSGEIPPVKRKNLWNRTVIISTPQVVYNDLVNGFSIVNDNWLIIFDEAHRSVKEHPYAKIARLVYSRAIPRIIGLTASPGDLDKTKEIMNVLRIEDLVLLTRSDYELRKYLQPIKWRIINISPPPQLRYAVNLIRDVVNDRIDKLKELLKGVSFSDYVSIRNISYTRLDSLRNKIEELYLENKLSNTNRKEATLVINQLILLDKLLTYIESYSYKSFIEYYKKLRSKALRRSVVAKLLLNTPHLNEAYVIVKELDESGYFHPKIEKLIGILKAEKGKTIVFVSMKNVALEIYAALNSRGVKASYLIGQNKGRRTIGMKQREQIMTIKNFVSGDYKVLVATHVGEEGLDISEVSNVIFYDNPVSAIRRIQREGRTGRSRPGNVYFLIMKGTRDESRYWAGVAREKRLYEELRSIKAEIIPMEDRIKPLTEFMHSKKQVKQKHLDIKIYVDYRERSGDITNILKENNIEIVLDQLPIGDYVLGDYVIERKTMEDLASSIIDGRLFKQLRTLRDSAGKPILIIEGNLIDFTKKLDLNIYTGTILSIIDDFNIPLLITTGSKETAEFLVTLAKRLSSPRDKYVKLRFDKKPLDIKEIQRFVLAGIPGINTVLADKLLQKFGSLLAIANASLDDLIKVEGIGMQLAQRIYKVFHSEY